MGTIDNIIYIWWHYMYVKKIRFIQYLKYSKVIEQKYWSQSTFFPSWILFLWLSAWNRFHICLHNIKCVFILIFIPPPSPNYVHHHWSETRFQGCLSNWLLKVIQQRKPFIMKAQSNILKMWYQLMVLLFCIHFWNVSLCTFHLPTISKGCFIFGFASLPLYLWRSPGPFTMI